MDDLFWNQLKIGNEQAYQLLYDKYAGMLYEYGMKVVADDDIVSEAIQSLFVYIFEKRQNLSKPISIEAYLYVSLKRLILKRLNKDERYMTVSLDDSESPVSRFNLEISMNETMEETAYKEDLLKNLQSALDKLTKKQREVIYLKYYKGMKNDEVALIMGLEVKTVKNLSSLAIANLRDLIKNMFKTCLSFAIFYYVWSLLK